MSTRTLRHRPKKWTVTDNSDYPLYRGRYKTHAYVIAAWYWLFSSTDIKIIHRH